MDVSLRNEPMSARSCRRMAAPRKNGIVMQKWRFVVTTCTGGSAMKTTAQLPIIGMDIAKKVFVRPESRLCLCFTGGNP
jgi:hypothetical protein